MLTHTTPIGQITMPIRLEANPKKIYTTPIGVQISQGQEELFHVSVTPHPSRKNTSSKAIATKDLPYWCGPSYSCYMGIK